VLGGLGWRLLRHAGGCASKGSIRPMLWRSFVSGNCCQHVDRPVRRARPTGRTVLKSGSRLFLVSVRTRRAAIVCVPVDLDAEGRPTFARALFTVVWSLMVIAIGVLPDVTTWPALLALLGRTRQAGIEGFDHRRQDRILSCFLHPHVHLFL